MNAQKLNSAIAEFTKKTKSNARHITKKIGLSARSARTIISHLPRTSLLQ